MNVHENMPSRHRIVNNFPIRVSISLNLHRFHDEIVTSTMNRLNLFQVHSYFECFSINLSIDQSYFINQVKWNYLTWN